MVRRTYAYAVFGVGLLLLVVGLLKVLPGVTPAGGALAFLGLALFGLSFIPGPPALPEPAPMSFFERVTALFVEPSRAFRNLRAHPRWVAALAVIVLFNFAYSTAFTRRLTPERIVGFTMDKVVERGWLPPEAAEQQKAEQIAQAKDPVRVAGGAVTSFAGTFALLAFFAALALLGVLMLGGRINFWQALAVLAHAWLPVVVISQALNLILLYVKDPDDIHPAIGAGGLVADNLGVLFSPAEHPVLFAAASAFGVLAFYGVWLTATGLRHGGERVSSSAGWSVGIGFWAIRLVLAAAASALFGNFMA